MKLYQVGQALAARQPRTKEGESREQLYWSGDKKDTHISTHPFGLNVGRRIYGDKTGARRSKVTQPSRDISRSTTLVA